MLLILALVPFGLLVWSTGLAPNPLVSAMNGVKKNPITQRLVHSRLIAVDPQHFNLVDISLITNDHLNIIMQDTNEPNPDVWAIGDASTIEEAPLPATAQGTRFFDDCLS
jgi:NADH dehydrogenase FAD-containing subunit